MSLWLIFPQKEAPHLSGPMHIYKGQGNKAEESGWHSVSPGAGRAGWTRNTPGPAAWKRVQSFVGPGEKELLLGMGVGRGGSPVCRADLGQPRPCSGPQLAILTRRLWAARPGLRVPKGLPSPNKVALTCQRGGRDADTHSTPVAECSTSKYFLDKFFSYLVKSIIALHCMCLGVKNCSIVHCRHCK